MRSTSNGNSNHLGRCVARSGRNRLIVKEKLLESSLQILLFRRVSLKVIVPIFYDMLLILMTHNDKNMFDLHDDDGGRCMTVVDALYLVQQDFVS